MLSLRPPSSPSPSAEKRCWWRWIQSAKYGRHVDGTKFSAGDVRCATLTSTTSQGSGLGWDTALWSGGGAAGRHAAAKMRCCWRSGGCPSKAIATLPRLAGRVRRCCWLIPHGFRPAVRLRQKGNMLLVAFEPAVTMRVLDKSLHKTELHTQV